MKLQERVAETMSAGQYSPEPTEGLYVELGCGAVERFPLTLPQGVEIPPVHLVMCDDSVTMQAFSPVRRQGPALQAVR